MLNETYIEVMVEKKASPTIKVVQVMLAAMIAAFIWMALLGSIWGIMFAIICAAICYYVSKGAYIEYEYIYVDKELQIDRIKGRNRRKRMATLDLQQMEVLAPMGSHELDSFRNRNCKKKDFSSGDGQKAGKYVLVQNDLQVIFEPTEEMVKMIHTIAPRRVFTY